MGKTESRRNVEELSSWPHALKSIVGRELLYSAVFGKGVTNK
jgi:hypothetical protein